VLRSSWGRVRPDRFELDQRPLIGLTWTASHSGEPQPRVGRLGKSVVLWRRHPRPAPSSATSSGSGVSMAPSARPGHCRRTVPVSLMGGPSSACPHTDRPAALHSARMARPGGHRCRRPAGPAPRKLRDAGQSIYASHGQPGAIAPSRSRDPPQGRGTWDSGR
jgi:hypothetical protein